jgi:hypothetical protein
VGEAGGERGRDGHHRRGGGQRAGAAVAEVALARAVLHVHLVRARSEDARLGVVLRGQVAARTHHPGLAVHCAKQNISQFLHFNEAKSFYISDFDGVPCAVNYCTCGLQADYYSIIALAEQ